MITFQSMFIKRFEGAWFNSLWENSSCFLFCFSKGRAPQSHRVGTDHNASRLESHVHNLYIQPPQCEHTEQKHDEVRVIEYNTFTASLGGSLDVPVGKLAV